ncbi:hypothetical protein IKG31_01325 [Candidatus Saccharibacteria bacterium]|nr:hypothetical protein [Candidatus Saccharibacteria bacterium]
MKCKPLTLDVINNLDKDSILYAEFSESGAMGACGTARIFVLDDGILQFYLVSVFDGKSDKRKKELNDIYAAVYGFLSSLTKQKILIEKYAGYGNTAWKRRGITFTRDDDHSIFLYKKSKQVYHIPASNPGVYHKVVADFAERQDEFKAIKKNFDAQKKKLSIAEQDFFDAYLNQLEENDHHLGIFQFTVAEYWDAICLLKLRNLQDFNLSSDAIRDGEKAIARYRLKYVIDTIGWNQLDEFFADYVKKGGIKLFGSLNSILSYHIEDLYTKFKIKKSNNSKTSVIISDNLEKFLEKPELVTFSENAIEEIINAIYNKNGDTLRADARSIEFFLANFCFLEDIPYSRILPVVHYIVKELPFDDFSHTDTAQLFWLAGEIINRAWRFAEPNNSTQRNISDFIFSAYGSRVGSLWPIVNYDAFEFKDPAGQEMFSDSIGFIMSLSDITERLPGLESYLRLVAARDYHGHPTVLSRAKGLIRHRLPAEEELEDILDHEDAGRYSALLSHPESVEETEVLLDRILIGDDRFDNYSRVAILERLFLNNANTESRIMAAKFINKNFREIAYLLNDDAKAADESPSEFIISIFTAACAGIYESEELTEIESIADKCQTLEFDTNTIVAALKLANQRVNKISNIRADLAEFFA